MPHAPDSARRVIVPAYVLFAAFGSFWGVWGASVPRVQERAGVGDGRLGFALLFVGAGALPSMLLAGRALDRWGPPVAAAAIAALGITGAGLALTAVDAASLCVGLALVGATSGAADVTMNAIAGRAEKTTGRPILTRAHGVFSGLVVLASLATGLASAAPLPLAVPFATVAVLCLLAGTCLRKTPPVSASPQGHSHVDAPTPASATAQGHDRIPTAGPASATAQGHDRIPTAGPASATAQGHIRGPAAAPTNVAAPGHDRIPTAAPASATAQGHIRGPAAAPASATAQGHDRIPTAGPADTTAQGHDDRGPVSAPAGAVAQGQDRVAAAAPADVAARGHDRVPAAGSVPLGRRRVVPLVLLGVLGALAFGSENAHQSWSAVFAHVELRSGEGLSAVAPAVFAGAVAVTRFSIGGLKAVHARTVLLVGAAAAACGALVIAAAPTLLIAGLGLTLAAAGTAVLFPTLLSVVSANVEESYRGRATSVVTAVSYLGFLVGPVYVGLWAEAVGLRGAMVAVAVLAGVLFVFTPALLRRSTAARPSHRDIVGQEEVRPRGSGALPCG